jgi:hypothetical protein
VDKQCATAISWKEDKQTISQIENLGQKYEKVISMKKEMPPSTD